MLGCMFACVCVCACVRHTHTRLSDWHLLPSVGLTGGIHTKHHFQNLFENVNQVGSAFEYGWIYDLKKLV